MSKHPLFLKTLNVTRYSLGETLTAEFLQGVPDILKRRAFHELDTSQAKGVGWASFADLTDTTFSDSPVEVGSYFVFSLRIDTRRIPAALFKKEVAIALKKENTRFISRAKRKDIKAQVKLRLLARTPATPSVFPVIWDHSRGMVYLFAGTYSAQETFETLFGQCFGLFPMLRNQEPDEPDFGKFMLWLWFYGDSTGGRINDNRRIFSSSRVTVSSGAAVVAASGCEEEARLGVRTGKTVTSLGVHLEDEHNPDSMWWEFTIKNSLSSLHGLKLPKVEKDDDPDSAFFDRIQMIEEAFSCFENAYEKCKNEIHGCTNAMDAWLSADEVPA